jgi:hypothetical protein
MSTKRLSNLAGFLTLRYVSALSENWRKTGEKGANTKMRMRDELIKDFGQKGSPANSYASAAEPNDNTYPARMNLSMGEPKDLPSLFGGENAGPPINLPERIAASESARRSDRSTNIGPPLSPAAHDTAAETEYGNLSEKMDQEVSAEETPLKLAKVAIFGDF